MCIRDRLSSDAIYEKKPDFIVILAWNFSESIMKKHIEYLESGGAFILPMPEPRIITKVNHGNIL